MRRKRGRPARKEEYLGPTPETLAKLVPDPLEILLVDCDVALERAASEIRAIYLAVCAKLMGGLGGGSGKPMSDFVAWAHAETYLPWARGLHRLTMEAVIDIVVDRHHIHPTFHPSVTFALESYARRMKTRKEPKEDAA